MSLDWSKFTRSPLKIKSNIDRFGNQRYPHVMEKTESLLTFPISFASDAHFYKKEEDEWGTLSMNRQFDAAKVSHGVTYHDDDDSLIVFGGKDRCNSMILFKYSIQEENAVKMTNHNYSNTPFEGEGVIAMCSSGTNVRALLWDYNPDKETTITTKEFPKEIVMFDIDVSGQDAMWSRQNIESAADVYIPTLKFIGSVRGKMYFKTGLVYDDDPDGHYPARWCLAELDLKSLKLKTLKWSENEGLLGASLVITRDGQYIVGIGGILSGGHSDHINIFDMKRKKTIPRKVRAPTAGLFQTLLIGNALKDEIVMFGFVRETFEAEIMSKLPKLPFHIIQMMAQWLCIEKVHVIKKTDYTGKDKRVEIQTREHWVLPVDLFISE